MTRKTAMVKPRKKPISLLVMQSREIGAAEFKARCLEIMDEVERTGIEIVITKHRRPVARLGPARGGATRFSGSMRGLVVRESDLLRPIEDEWDADEPNFA